MYEDLKLRREGEREGEGVYIQETRSCDATRDSSLSGDKLARHRPSAVTHARPQLSHLVIPVTNTYCTEEHFEVKNTLTEIKSAANSAQWGGSSEHICLSYGGLRMQCTSCAKPTYREESYACTQCLRSVCQICFVVLMAIQWKKRTCPWCAVIGPQFQPNN